MEEYCKTCGNKMNSWDMRLSKAFKVYNTCENCFCSIYDMDQQAFRKKMEDYFDMRPCKGI